MSLEGVDYVVVGVRAEKEVEDNFLKYTADGTYLIVYVTVTNNSNSHITVDGFDSKLCNGDVIYPGTTLLVINEGLNPDLSK